MSNTEHVESIDAPVDEGMVDLVEFFVENGFMTTNSCSALIEDHFNDDELDVSKDELEAVESYQYAFLQRPYLTFEPMYHTQSENGDIEVDKEYYEFKSRLSESISLAVRDDDNPIGRSQIKMSLVETGNPYTTTDRYQYMFEYDVQKLREIFDYIDHDFELYDSILKTAFRLTKIIFQYPLLGSRLTMDIDIASGDIQIGCSSLPYIPENVDESLFMITELEGENTVGKFDVSGELEDIYREFFKKQSREFFEDVRVDLDREIDVLSSVDR